ncbi:L-ascorbate metabolism protein UlaG, beta-lactamase superfamily [Stigmatella aurantiaca]|uniref:L-ascorbate metabolism protein UlaG, beta-lactamase superfamily n=1 Tax=Stigmatella aurantiaca TaxID=41 RepID=A0A1H7LT08_STIAU|nr:MBL fold metallo-hydrolase [Stigmatella aurantiaca]SEL01605.1 L-ascorbate metabolism protein UlaG, beta-lactamase superfamily [Stigmatella aurantiaca]
MRQTRMFMAAAVALTVGLFACSDDKEEEAPFSGDVISTSRGKLTLHPVNHASFVMYWAGKTLYVDPVGETSLYEGLPRPDAIFVTDIHGDHLSANTLTALVQDGTVIVAPQAVKDALPAALQEKVQVLANGGTLKVVDVSTEAIPMYNLTPERLQYHAKGRGNGYVLTFGKTRVYIAGDTEDIPEMRALTGIDVAFLPMNLPYTMTVQQAADAVRAFKPKVVYPYHFRDSDLAEFTRLVGTDVGVEVRVRDWY